MWSIYYTGYITGTHHKADWDSLESSEQYELISWIYHKQVVTKC